MLFYNNENYDLCIIVKRSSSEGLLFKSERYFLIENDNVLQNMTLYTIIANYSDDITFLSFPFHLSFNLRFLSEAKHRCFINKYLRNNNVLIAGPVKAAR